MTEQPINSIIYNTVTSHYNINNLFSNKYVEICEDNNYYNEYHEFLVDNVNNYKELYCNKPEWNLLKKLINDYELLHIKNNSIASYKPLSRSYYKLREFLYEYNIIDDIIDDIIDKNKKLNVFSMAEAPGGFIDACYNYFYDINFNNYFIDGISLIQYQSNVPNWNHIYHKIKNNPKINIIDEIDGDLYKLKTIKYCISKKKKYNIITADGGFDFSEDFFNQEHQFCKLLFCEIVTAISLQALGGTFICKCFDINTKLTQDIIYILYCAYQDITFVKPSISRNTNSEKYIIAKNFKGVKYKTLNKLYNILKQWDNEIVKFKFNISHEYYTHINIINQHYLEKQYECYKQIMELEKNIDAHTIKNIVKSQIEKCIIFCYKYNIRINENSDYINLSLDNIIKKYYEKYLIL
jgi:23S rRNA U2552 (ribose-2'-O)-methylase RlmE/FtsJ